MIAYSTCQTNSVCVKSLLSSQQEQRLSINIKPPLYYLSLHTIQFPGSAQRHHQLIQPNSPIIYIQHTSQHTLYYPKDLVTVVFATHSSNIFHSDQHQFFLFVLHFLPFIFAMLYHLLYMLNCFIFWGVRDNLVQ